MGIFAQKVFAKNALVRSVMLSVGLGVMWGWGYGMLSHPAVNATLAAVIGEPFAESDIQKTATTLRALLSTETTRVQVLQEIVDWTHTKLTIASVWGGSCASLTKETLKRLSTVYDNVIAVEEDGENTLGQCEITVTGAGQKCAFRVWVEKLTAFADKEKLDVVTRVYGLRGYIKENFTAWFLAQRPREVVVSAAPLTSSLEIISPHPDPASPPKDDASQLRTTLPLSPTMPLPKKLTDLKIAIGQLQAKLQQVLGKLRDLKLVAPTEAIIESRADDSSDGDDDELLAKQLGDFEDEVGAERMVTSPPVERSVAPVRVAPKGLRRSFAEDVAATRKQLGFPQKPAGKQRNREGSALLPAGSLEKEAVGAVHHGVTTGVPNPSVVREKRLEGSDDESDSSLRLPNKDLGAAEFIESTRRGLADESELDTGDESPISVLREEEKKAPVITSALVPGGHDDSGPHGDTTPVVPPVRSKRPIGGVGAMLPFDGSSLRHVRGSHSMPAVTSVRSRSKPRSPAKSGEEHEEKKQDEE